MPLLLHNECYCEELFLCTLHDELHTAYTDIGGHNAFEIKWVQIWLMTLTSYLSVCQHSFHSSVYRMLSDTAEMHESRVLCLQKNAPHSFFFYEENNYNTNVTKKNIWAVSVSMSQCLNLYRLPSQRNTVKGFIPFVQHKKCLNTTSTAPCTMMQ